MKRKYMVEQRRDLTKDTLLKLPTYSGYNGRLFLDNGYALTHAEATTGIFTRVGNEIKSKKLDSAGIVGETIPFHINLSIGIDQTRLMQIQELYNAHKDSELEMAINGSMKKVQADLNFGLSWALINGKGGNDPQYSNYVCTAPTANNNYVDSTFTSLAMTNAAGYASGTAFSVPSIRQPEGIYTYCLNPLSTKLYNIDQSTNSFYKAKVYDFYTLDAAPTSATKFVNAPFGYNATAIFDAWTPTDELTISASALMAITVATGSLTPNVPAIIDIVSQCIDDRIVNGEKPHVGICRRDLFSLMKRAIISSKWGGGIQGMEKVDDLVKMGYEEQIVINGVAIIPDDTKRDLLDSGTVAYATPANAIMLLNLDSFTFEAHQDYNFVMDNEWVKQPGVVGQYTKEINATCRMALSDLQKQTLIQFGKIDFGA
jgi:hypothetical protein